MCGACCHQFIPDDQCEKCTEENCPRPRDCIVTNWTAWSACAPDCQEGTKIRTRAVLQTAIAGGAACPVMNETKTCGSGLCPNYCQASANPSPLAGCNVCGQCCQSYITQGALCDACVDVNCPRAVSCEVGDYGAWGACSKSCGGGKQTRYRNITIAPKGGGRACPALNETWVCNSKECAAECNPNKGCNVCEACCHDYIQDGDSCTACNTELCTPLACNVTGWGEWSSCSASCGNGTRVRHRNMTAATVLARLGAAELSTDLESC